MKFKQGKIIDVFESKGEIFNIRFIKSSDAQSFLKFMNSLVSEKSFINMTKKVTLKQEKQLISDKIKNSKSGKIINLCVENNKRIVASSELKVLDKPRNSTAEFFIGVEKKYRRYGLARKMFSNIVEIAKNSGIDTIKSSYFYGNTPSKMFQKELGFKKIGVLPKSVHHYNKILDEIHLYKKIKK